MLQNKTRLETVRDYEHAQAANIPPDARPHFHLTPMTGWMNDPNGFCFYNGVYHLFYQYHPYSTVWGPMHWGHATSTDLLHWRHLPAALAPDTDADAGGCFSGSAVEAKDGKLLLLYTGVQPGASGEQDHQVQCLAIGDGLDFEKYTANPVIGAAALPQGYSAVDFRDPKIWREDDRYYCVVGSRHQTEQGSALLFESPDALHWQYCATLDASRGEYGKMWECPDFFELDGKQLLLVSPQEMQGSADGEFHPGDGTVALLGRYNKQARTFAREAAQPIDYGFEFYAPQTTLAPDGRRLMVAWMQSWIACPTAPRPNQWFGRMSTPRELRLRNGRLCQAPVREIETLWGEQRRLDGITVNGDADYPELSGRLMDMTVTVDVAASPDCRYFALRFAQSERHYTEICCDLQRGELVFDRSRCGTRRDVANTRRVKAMPQNGKLTLRLLLDKDCAELFINDGESTVTALLEAPPHAQGVSLHADGAVKLDILHHTITD